MKHQSMSFSFGKYNDTEINILRWDVKREVMDLSDLMYKAEQTESYYYFKKITK